MAGKAKTVLGKKARKALVARVQPYYVSIGKKKSLGYVPGGDKENGAWLIREKIDGLYKRTRFATADDYTDANGTSILTYEQAVEKAFADAVVPGKEKMGLTVLCAIDDYYDDLAREKNKDNVEQYRAAIKAKLDNPLGKVILATRVDELTTKQLKKWRTSLLHTPSTDPKANAEVEQELQRRSQSSVNRVLACLKAPLNKAFEEEENGIPSAAAWARVKPFKNVEGARKDDLEPAQVLKLIECAAKFDQPLADLIEATYLIGCRAPGEIMNVNVEHFDAKRHSLHIPGGKTGSRDVVLTDEAVAFFKKHAKDKTPKAPLIALGDGSRWPKMGHFRMVKRAVKCAKLPSTVCLYTLRHAHISRAIEAGRPLSMIAENCGTSLLMIQRNYAKVMKSTQREVMQNTAPAVLRVVA